jgi:hypothetical protein
MQCSITLHPIITLLLEKHKVTRLQGRDLCIGRELSLNRTQSKAVPGLPAGLNTLIKHLSLIGLVNSVLM